MWMFLISPKFEWSFSHLPDLIEAIRSHANIPNLHKYSISNFTRNLNKFFN